MIGNEKHIETHRLLHYLEKQSESDPLVVADVATLVLLVNVASDDPGMRHLVAHV